MGGIWNRDIVLAHYRHTTVTLIAWAVIRVGGDRGRTRQGEKSPVEIAQQRLAQGEITQKQFDDLKKSLG